MLTNEQVADVIADLSWCPGWYLRAVETRKGDLVLLISGTAPNSYRPDEITNLWIAPPIPEMSSVGQLHDWICLQVERVAIHEAREWLRGSDGRPVFDPH